MRLPPLRGENEELHITIELLCKNALSPITYLVWETLVSGETSEDYIHKVPMPILCLYQRQNAFYDETPELSSFC